MSNKKKKGVRLMTDTPEHVWIYGYNPPCDCEHMHTPDMPECPEIGCNKRGTRYIRADQPPDGIAPEREIKLLRDIERLVIQRKELVEALKIAQVYLVENNNSIFTTLGRLKKKNIEDQKIVAAALAKAEGKDT